MALIAVAADKGAPGVTTTALALAAVWARPVLLAECDPAGGDLIYRFPGAGGRLDPRRGVLSLAVAARRGLQEHQVWEHVQKLHGGLDVLTGVTNAEQGAGLNLLWGPLGRLLAGIPQADVIADCGRLGPDGPIYDLLAEAMTLVLVTRPHLGDVIRLRDRAAALAAAMDRRGRRGFASDVVVVAEEKRFRAALAEVGHAIAQGGLPARITGGLADDAKGAELLRGEWGGRLDRTGLIRTARQLAQQMATALPVVQGPPAQGADGPGYPVLPAQQPPVGAVGMATAAQRAPWDGGQAHGAGPRGTGPIPLGAQHAGQPPAAGGRHAGPPHAPRWAGEEPSPPRDPRRIGGLADLPAGDPAEQAPNGRGS
ncbi:MAG: hypothetical protein JOY82_16010 [Streptosporangiaceae bacterium]|nr:hypothetical protein [Streptosporangiaceae bacterium]MBV9855997.1 hypothetical protein [Streptosporangiaceae bacterium]